MTLRFETLDSGLRIVTDKMDYVDSVALGVAVGTGSRHEDASTQGIAHLLEHMAFKGTETRSARTLAEEMESVGGQSNACTGRESTFYYAKMLAEDSDQALDILADILCSPKLDPKELNREQGVVLQEIAMTQDTPDDLVFDHFQAAAFPNQAMGRSILGTADLVSSFTPEDLRVFMHQHYHASNLVITAAGRVDHERFRELSDKYFSNLGEFSHTSPEPAIYHGSCHLEPRVLEQLHVVIGFPGVSRTDDDYAVKMVLTTLLGGGMSSRLFQEIREKRGMAYAVHAFGSSWRETGLWGVYIGCAPERSQELIDLLRSELARASVDIGQKEIDRARAQLRAALLMSRESVASRAEYAAMSVLTYGRARSDKEILAEIEAVTIDRCRALLTRMLTGQATVAAIGPEASLKAFEGKIFHSLV